jgi:hypothetical protein
VDLGLRLNDIETMGLQSEPSPNRRDSDEAWEKRAETLDQHGATEDEIDYLRRDRVELNAMPSDVFVDFVERKLALHGIGKVVPPDDVLEQHADRVITRTLLNRRLDGFRAEVDAEAARLALPADLRQQVEAWLRQNPALPWDVAIAMLADTLADPDRQ